LNKNILIIQGEIPIYRIPFFNKLGQQPGVHLSVVYSGKPLENVSLNFSALHVKKIGMGGLKFQFFNLTKLSKFDTVIVPLDVSWLSSVLVCFIRRSKSFFLWGHGLGKSSLFNKIRGLMMRKAAGVILYDQEAIQAIRLYTDKVFVAPNTVQVIPEFNEDSERTTFLYVGRVQVRKKVDELIDAFALIVNKIPAKIRIEIVGGDDPALREKIKNYQLTDRVNFLGEIRDDNFLKPVFHRALAYVSPGHVGLGVLHSFAFGVPVVTRQKANHAPEFHNLVDQHNALLYNGSIQELSNVLLRLDTEPGLSKQLGHNGYSCYINERSMDQMVGGFLQAVKS
jgi:glycosyltransferase involved in cell wall biosynthesis